MDFSGLDPDCVVGVRRRGRAWNDSGIFAPASSVTISRERILPLLVLDAWLRDAALQSH